MLGVRFFRRELMVKIAVAAFMIVILLTSNTYADERNPQAQENHNINAGIEYYFPKDEDRQIQSVFAYALYGKEYLNKLHLFLPPAQSLFVIMNGVQYNVQRSLIVHRA